MAVVAAVVVLVGLPALLAVGRRAGSAPSDPTTPTRPTTAAAPATAPPPAGGRSPVLGPVVPVHVEGGDHAVGGLQSDTVLRMSVFGFGWFAAGRAEQCVVGPLRRCGNAIDVQFDEDGHASFQYLVMDDFIDAVPGCRVDDPPCAIVVSSVDGDATAVVSTLFHDRLPPPVSVRVEPSAGLDEAGTVQVAVEGLPANAEARVVLCAAPYTPVADWCGAPGPTVPIRADADGAAAAALTLHAGPVGRQRAVCGRGANCAVSVVSDAAFVRAAPARITFAKPPGVDYDPSRLVAGLGMAVLLLASAGWLIRRTDWSPIGEEAAPEIDDAVYADLDAIVAALPPAPDLDDLIAASR